MCWRAYYALLQAKTAIDLNFKYRDKHSYLSTFYRDYFSSHYKYVSSSPPLNKNIESTIKKASQPSNMKKSYA